MLVKYTGNRPVVSIMCSGRVNYIFCKDNNYMQYVDNPQHAAQLFRSVQHKFVAVPPEVQEAKEVVKEEPIFEHHAIAEPGELSSESAVGVAQDPTELPKKTKKVYRRKTK